MFSVLVFIVENINELEKLLFLFLVFYVVWKIRSINIIYYIFCIKYRIVYSCLEMKGLVWWVSFWKVGLNSDSGILDVVFVKEGIGIKVCFVFEVVTRWICLGRDLLFGGLLEIRLRVLKVR